MTKFESFCLCFSRKETMMLVYICYNCYTCLQM